MNSDPNKYTINGEFASSGNDNSVMLTLNVPAHTIPANTDSERTVSVPAPSRWDGKQMRAIFQYENDRLVPGNYVVAMLDATSPSGAIFYAFFDVTRISGGDIQLRCRIPNIAVPASSLSVPAFTVRARVRTVIGN